MYSCLISLYFQCEEKIGRGDNSTRPKTTNLLRLAIEIGADFYENISKTYLTPFGSRQRFHQFSSYDVAVYVAFLTASSLTKPHSG
jgi:hypothetical protein